MNTSREWSTPGVDHCCAFRTYLALQKLSISGTLEMDTKRGEPMAAQALYLKYRPQTFGEVVGQEPIMRTLRNALRQGKTTTARLLAKAVNCLAPEGERPCNVCPICVAINEGRLLDLIEIDAASNRGIDEIRDIREKVGFRPNEGRYKVYVLDEAHMLTEAAFNALLKTLEEPPPHVIFALVTTDPHKIPATIASRCQRFDFRRISLQAIVDHLAFIAGEEGIPVEPDALEFIAYQGTGAMRDAISLLDQLTSYGARITLDQVQMVLGTVAGEAAAELVACLADGEIAAGLDRINRTVSEGASTRQFGREVVEYLRGLLLIKQGTGTRLIHATAEQAAEMEALANRMSDGQLLRAIQLFNKAVTDVKSGLQVIPQLPLELALVESILDPAQPATPGQLQTRQEPVPVSINITPQHQSRPEGKSVAERHAPAPAPVTDTSSSPPAETRPPSQSATAADRLTLKEVEGAWDEVLVAVRQRNPTAEGALRSGCKVVEVNGNQVVVTFPYPFLREKLGDPQRKVEIQDALSQVLGGNCLVKLVLASEYVPTRQTTPGPPAPVSNSAPTETAMDAQDLDQLTRWAEERGGKTMLIEEP
jgi:DNA polymerase-3 subunit gamma/tau